MKHLITVAGLAGPFLAPGACGNRDAERAAPEAASLEADATTGVGVSNPGATPSIGAGDTAGRHVDQAGHEGATTPPPSH